MKYSVVGTLAAGMSLLPLVAHAQAPCHGTPRGTTLAYEYGKLSGANTQGVAATFAVVRVGARVRDIDESNSGNEFDLRVSVPIGTSRIQVCPLLGVGYLKDEWEIDAASTMTTQTLTLKGGASIGAEFPVAAGFSAIPFLQVAYRFSASKFDIEDQTTADTASVVDIEYGLVGRYRNLFAGVAANRDGDTEGVHPYQARWILGFSFSGGSRSSHAAIPAVRGSPRKP